MSNYLQQILRGLRSRPTTQVPPSREQAGDTDEVRKVDLGRRRVDGDYVRRLCRQSGYRRLRVRGGVVTSAVDLSATELERPIAFERTTFSGQVDLAGGRFRELVFRDCRLLSGVSGNGLVVDGDLDLGGCSIDGALSSSASTSRRSAIWLCEAEIGGRLLARGLRINTQSEEQYPLVRALQADRIRVHGNVRLIEGFEAAGEVRLIGAEIAGSLDLTGCRLSDPRLTLDLAKAQIGGSVFIIPSPSTGAPPSIDGRIDMSRAAVSGQMLVRALKSAPSAMGVDPAYYAYVRADEPVAIWAPGCHFTGEVIFDDDCEISGAVDMRGATFRSDLFLGGVRFTNENGFSVDLSNGSVGGDLTLSPYSRSVSLNNLRVEGSVIGRGSVVLATMRSTVAARGLRVEGDVDLNNLEATGGAVDLRLAQISGDLRLRAAKIRNAGAQSLALSSAQVQGIVYLDAGFESEGAVRLNRCRIGGSLNFDGGSFRWRQGGADLDRPAIDATDCEAATGMFLRWHLDGAADFSNARTSVFGDDVDRWGDDYSLAGIRFERFSPDAGEASVDRRLSWLARQGELDTSSYELLAAHYRDLGRSGDAERLLIARNRALRKGRLRQGGWRNLRSAATDLFWDVSVGYGYQAGRAALAMVLLTLMTGFSLSTAVGRDAMRTIDEDNTVYTAAGRVVSGPADESDSGSLVGDCAGGRVRCFSPWFYAIDTVVPLVDLHQRSTWHPDRDADGGRSFELGLNLVVLMGWAVSSALVLGLTNAAGRGSR